MLVSVITVCYNSELYIEQTIQSILNQTYKEIEYIIIDGGSTDNTLNIVSKYIPYFKGRIKLISEPDKGIYDAMNKGIQMAKGELVGIINSDDWYEADAIETIVKYYDKEDEILYGLMTYINNEKIAKVDIPDHNILPLKMITHPTVFIPKWVYQEYGVFDTTYKVAADYDLMLKHYRRKAKFKMIPKVISNFREGGISYFSKELCMKEGDEIRKKYGYKDQNIIEKAEGLELFFERINNRIKKKVRKIAIYGTGTHTKVLLNYIHIISGSQIIGLIDREIIENKLYGYKVSTLENILPQIDTIIISSQSYESEIYERIKYLEGAVEIIKIYSAASIEEANSSFEN